MQRDSILNTFLVAIGVCLVCSFLVSSAAVGLRPLQEKNAEQDRKGNILQAAGFTKEQIKDAGGVFKLFDARVEPIIVNLATGEEEGVDEILAADPDDDMETKEDAIAKFDQIQAAAKKRDGLYREFDDKKEDIAGISRVEKFSHVYLIKDENGNLSKYVFPIRGKGLWSILKGFIALETDFETIAGLTYYEHGETPGLGGEVDNPKWKQQWKGKSVYDQAGNVEIEVIKGIAEPDDRFAVDGLSGATITSRGVTNMIHFWLGPDGFKPFIEKQQEEMKVSKATNGEPS
jgi:Na+-transporting NADH:ubiquinone oxidoreductase subunit C